MKEKAPPHSFEAEAAVLGGMLLDSEALVEVIDIWRPAYFYFPAHQTIFETIHSLCNRGVPADILSLSDQLKSQNLLEQVGGISYLTEILNSVPTTANVSYYAQLIERNAILQQGLQRQEYSRIDHG